VRATSVVASNNETRVSDDVADDEVKQAMEIAQSLLTDFVRYNFLIPHISYNSSPIIFDHYFDSQCQSHYCSIIIN
jgi:hypothetical protein